MTAGRLIGTGEFRLYEQPGGSALLEWNDCGEPGTGGSQEIPAEVWKLLKAVMAGRKIGPQTALRLLAGGRSVRRGLE
jgi:hypothetical protein